MSEQTDKSRYPSLYSPEKYVTEVQYICELICEKKAMADKTTLPMRFWLLPEWKSFYTSNLRVVHKTLEMYSAAAIIKTLKESGKWWSLRSPFMQKKIAALDAVYKREASTFVEAMLDSPVIDRASVSEFRPKKVKRNNLSALQDFDEDIDGEKKE